MSFLRLVFDGLRYHARMNLAVALGVAVATAVLTGAMLVGDSMRGSLRQLVVERLGRIDEILVVDRFFREELADELQGTDAFPKHFTDATPAILLEASASQPETKRLASGVNVIAMDELRSFGFDDSGGSYPQPADDEILLNYPLAERLGVDINEIHKKAIYVVLRLPTQRSIPEESALGRKSDILRSRQLKVIGVEQAIGFGRFSLRSNQQAPLNAYTNLATIQSMLEQPGRVNTIIVRGDDNETASSEAASDWLAKSLKPKLTDYGLSIERRRRTFNPPDGTAEQVIFDYFALTSDRMMLDSGVEQAAERAFDSSKRQTVLTYLANTIKLGVGVEKPAGVRDEIPYSTITAIDSRDSLRGPLTVNVDGKPIGDLGEQDIVLNQWAAEQLGAKVGDPIDVTFFEPETTHGRTKERTESLRLLAIAPLTEPVDPFDDQQPAVYDQQPHSTNDPHLTPTVPGITDQKSLADWDAPFPYDSRRIKPPDDRYWDNHRTTPKAFVPLATGRRLWASRFGAATNIRFPASDYESPDQIAERLNAEIDPAKLGFVFRAVKRRGLAAATGTTPFSMLFFGFSMFIIAAAVMLLTLLFRLGVEQRAEQVGALLAIGLSRRKTYSVFVTEGLFVATLGALLGVVLGVYYAVLMILGLNTWWLDAIRSQFLRPHITWPSLMIGFGAGLFVAIGAMIWTLWRMRRISIRRLMAGQAEPPVNLISKRSRWRPIVAVVSLLAAIGMAIFATGQSGEAQAGMFFGAGALTLTAALLGVSIRLRRGDGSLISTGGWALPRMATRNAGRHPGRSLLTIGLVAAAVFVVGSISVFRLDPTESGVGGFDVIVEGGQPIYYDLSTKDGRHDLPFSVDEFAPAEEAPADTDEPDQPAIDRKALADATIFSLRVRGGDDASCLNLYQSDEPRVLGLPAAMIEHNRFAWADSLADTDNEKKNPWLLVNQLPEHGVVPAVLDKNTAAYSLKVGLGDQVTVGDGRGGEVTLRIVGLLSNSVMQGDLLISESNFRQAFPDENGFRMFLIDAPDGAETTLRDLFDENLADFGFVVTPARRRLADLLAVQNTYLSTFQSLGALGLLLGTFGLVTVELRNVLERRGELALLRAVGFTQQRLGRLVMLENAALLLGGVAVGAIAALVAVAPHLIGRSGAVPIGELTIMFAIIMTVGLLAGMIAVWATLRAPLIGALRGD